ncbi:MAG: tRNA (adenosine(37)-N6)-dimethylallyltransferase MiaA [Pseudomonadota bacterium]
MVTTSTKGAGQQTGSATGRRGAILIAGPTASGKSALAMALARQCGGVIVNTDSMQVYRDLRIVTARPSIADERAAPHLLYGHVDGSIAYSAGRFVREVEETVLSKVASDVVPIFVGGTGLYFDALLGGLSPIPDIPSEIRARWRAASDAGAVADLHRALAARDPVMANRLPPGDRQRIVRALEVIEGTGRSLAEWQKEPGRPLLDAAEVIKIRLTGTRGQLYARSDARFDAMMEAGALDEVARLAARGLSDELPIMRALGVPSLMKLSAGLVSYVEAIDQAKRQTRQYIKRQLTWQNARMQHWMTLDVSENYNFDGADFQNLFLELTPGMHRF